MRRYLRYALFSGVCLLLSVFFTFALVGYRFLGLCLFALAALGAVLGLLRAWEGRRPRAARSLRRLIWCALAIFLAALAATETVIISNANTDTVEADRAIVLGAGVHGSAPSRSLRARLDAALRFAKDNPTARLVLSGGQGPGEDITEAMCMYEWLTERGVDPDRLILEERASSTEENLRFSKELLEQEGWDGGRVCVITAGYHIARARLMAGDAGFTSVTAMGASTGMPVLEFNYYLREAPAIWWYLVSG